MKRMIAVCILIALSCGVCHAQPAVKTKEQAIAWRSKAQMWIDEASDEIDAIGASRLKLGADLKKLDDELILRKPMMAVADYDRALAIITTAKKQALSIIIQLDKAQTDLTKAKKLKTASDNQWNLTLYVASGNKALDAAISANAALGHLTRGAEFIDIGYERWALIDGILKKYRTVE